MMAMMMLLETMILQTEDHILWKIVTIKIVQNTIWVKRIILIEKDRL